MESNSGPPGGRRRRVWVAALIVVAGVAAISVVATAQTTHQLRLLARQLVDGRIEVGLQQHWGDRWGERLLPAQRFAPAAAPAGRWLMSSPLIVEAGQGVLDLRIAARRLADGRIEVTLQQRRSGVWGDRILPRHRFAPARAPAGVWLSSSPLAGPRHSGEPGPADEAQPADGVGPVAGGPEPPEDRGTGAPPALLTPTGVPVTVVGTAGTGYLVRTPCGNTAEISTGEPIRDVRIVLDPGHGGRYETGARGPNGLNEDDLNLRLSRAILGELARRGVPAATTRSGDYGSLLSVRADFADALEADALISIHHNAPTHRLSGSPGSEVYVQSVDDRTPRSASARLGGLLYEEITAALATFADVSWSRLGDAGVLRVLLPSGGDAYGMIRRPAIPAVLVEYGYLSNLSEAELFATDEYLRVAAAATADAIEAYLDTARPGAGFVARPRVFYPFSAPSRCAEIRLE